MIAFRERDHVRDPRALVASVHRRNCISADWGIEVATILVADDDTTLLHVIAHNLRHEGHHVLTVADGEATLALANSALDLIVLDVLLPKIDGFEVCRRLRQTSAVPILMLTAKSDPLDRVVGLEVGADDYLPKPFEMRELLARTKALLRRRDLITAEITRRATAPPEELVVAGDLEIDVAHHRVRKSDVSMGLSPKEFELLAFLVRHRGQIFSAERLLRSVWGYNTATDINTVPVFIRSLREKIEDDPSHPRYIVTIRGVGYQFNG